MTHFETEACFKLRNGLLFAERCESSILGCFPSSKMPEISLGTANGKVLLSVPTRLSVPKNLRFHF